MTSRTKLAIAVLAAILMGTHAGFAATFTWNGGGGNDNWSTGTNWSGGIAPPNDGSADIVMAGTVRLTPNVDSAWSINKLTFLNGAGAFTLGGSQITVEAGGLAQGDDSQQTINNAVQVGAAQTWSATNWGPLVINGNLTGSSNVTINNSNLWNTIRLGGSNSGFTGNMNLNTGGNQSVNLLKPSAMIGGNIPNGGSGSNSILYLNGTGSPGTYTLGAGTGPGQTAFRMAGYGGVAPSGPDVNWDPGNGGDYSLTYTGFEFAAPTGGTAGVNFGNASSRLILTSGNKSINGVNYSFQDYAPASVCTILSALSDDGTARTLTITGSNTVLTRAASGGNLGGATTVSGNGSLAVSNLNQIFSGNLSLSGGTLILDSTSWSAFTSARSYGAGANQWQLGNGGFAARGSDLLINSTPAGLSWDKNFQIGSLAWLNGAPVADHVVNISTPIALTAARTITAFGACNESTTDWTVRGPANEISGQISGAVGTLTIGGWGAYGVTDGGILRFSNAGNSFVGAVNVIGGAVAAFTSDGAFGNAANTVTAGEGGGGASGMILLDDQNVSGPTTFSRAVTVNSTSDGSGGRAGFGSYSGDTIYTGTATFTGPTSWNNVPIHVQSGTMTLGTDATAATFTNSRGTALIYNKGGPGELIFGNVSYAGSPTSYVWVNREGTITTTKDPSVVGSPGGQLSSANAVFDNLIYTGNGATWKVTTNDQTYTMGGSGHFGNNTLNVANGITLTTNMTSGNVLGVGDGSTVWLLSKQGAGTWVYSSNVNGGAGWGGANGYVQVDQGTLELRGVGGVGGGMGYGVSLRMSGGTVLLNGGYGTPFYYSPKFEIDADGGKIGISSGATGDVFRTYAITTWTQGTAPVTLAARGNLNLQFMNAAFQDINAGSTLLIDRDGTGTGRVIVYDTAVAVNGTIGGSGELQLGASSNGTLTVNGAISPGDSPGTLTIDGNLAFANNAAYDWDLGASSYDSVIVNGALTFGANATLQLHDLGGIPDPSVNYVLFTYTGADPTNPAWTLDYSAAPRWYRGYVWLDAVNNRVMLSGLTPVPEPATVALATIGVLGLLIRRR